MKESTSSKLRIFALALAFASVIVVLLGIGKPVRPPFSTSLSLKGPGEASSAAGVTAIIDDSMRRLVVLNDRDELVGVVSLDTSELPCDSFGSVCVGEDGIYVSGIQFQEGTTNVKSERVMRFSKTGTFQRDLWVLKNEDEKNPHDLKAIYDIDLQGKTVLALLANANDPDFSSRNTQFDLYDTTQENGKGKRLESFSSTVSLPQAEYTASAQAVVSPSAVGTIYVFVNGKASEISVSGAMTCAAMSGQGAIYAFDDTANAIVQVDKNGACTPILEHDYVSSLNLTGGVLSACNNLKGEVIQYDLGAKTSKTLAEVRYGTAMLLRCWGFWLACLYLVAFVVVLIAQWVRASVASHGGSGLGSKLAALGVVVALVVIGARIADHIWMSTYSMRCNELGMAKDFLIASWNDVTAELAGNQSAQGSKPAEPTGAAAGITSENSAANPYDRLLSYLDRLRHAGSSNEIELYYKAYYMEDGGLYNFFSNDMVQVMGSRVIPSKEEAIRAAFAQGPASDDELRVGSTTFGQNLYYLMRLDSTTADGGKDAIVVEIGCHVAPLERIITGNTAQLFVALLVLLLVVYLSYSELRACGRSLVNFRLLLGDEATQDDALSLLTRPLSFFATFLQGIDSVMMVLIAKNLLQSNGMDAGLVSIPALSLGIGIACGYFLYGTLAGRLSLRSLLLVCAGTIAFVSLGVLGTVYVGNFWLFCLGKFAMSVPMGVLYVASYLMPRRARSEEVRRQVSSAVTSTDESAPALAAVLGGYVAQFLGDAWIYAMIAVTCLPIIVLATRWVPKDRMPIERQAPDSRAQMLEYLRAATPIGLVLFAVLPRAVMGGYSSYLFPLYATGLELTKTDITNFAVLGQLLTYLSLGTLDAAKRTFDPWRMIVIGLGGACVVYFVFMFNHALAWAVTAIALLAVLRKMCTNWKGLWLKAGVSAGLPEGIVMSTGLSFEGAANVGKPLFMSAALALGRTASMPLLSAFFLTCAVGYVLTTRNSVIAPNAGKR